MVKSLYIYKLTVTMLLEPLCMCMYVCMYIYVYIYIYI